MTNEEIFTREWLTVDIATQICYKREWIRTAPSEKFPAGHITFLDSFDLARSGAFIHTKLCPDEVTRMTVGTLSVDQIGTLLAAIPEHLLDAEWCRTEGKKLVRGCTTTVERITLQLIGPDGIVKEGAFTWDLFNCLNDVPREILFMKMAIDVCFHRSANPPE